MSIRNINETGKVAEYIVANFIVNNRRIPSFNEVTHLASHYQYKEDVSTLMERSLQKADELLRYFHRSSLEEMIEREIALKEEACRKKEAFRRMFSPITWIKAIRQFFYNLELKTRPTNKP